MIPYRGVNGYRQRERDEGGHQVHETRATETGTCADTGAAIRPGDIIQRDRNGRVVLLRSMTPGGHR